MSDLNRVYLVGNLVKDPEMKNIGSSNKVTNFTIASNRHWTGPEGQKNEEVSFIDCSAYGKRAETINTYLSKGRKVLIDGRIKQEKWTDKESQKTQSRLRVIVESFHFMDSKKNNEDATGSCVPAEAGGTGTCVTPVGDNDFDIC